MGDMPGCIAEIAKAMIAMLANTTEQERRIVDRYVSDIPNADPQQVLLQLRVCYGGFTKLYVRTRSWSAIGLKPTRRGPLYQLVSSPGATPAYFTVEGRAVKRVQPLRLPKNV